MQSRVTEMTGLSRVFSRSSVHRTTSITWGTSSSEIGGSTIAWHRGPDLGRASPVQRPDLSSPVQDAIAPPDHRTRLSNPRDPRIVRRISEDNTHTVDVVMRLAESLEDDLPDFMRRYGRPGDVIDYEPCLPSRVLLLLRFPLFRSNNSSKCFGQLEAAG
jgi:hypothetical protein